MVQLYTRVSRSLALPISTMPRFIIPLADKLDSSIGGMPANFTRNSTATYIDVNGLVQTAGIDIPRFQNGRYLCEPAATNLIENSQNLSSWDNTWGGGVTLISGLDTIAGLPAFRLIQIDGTVDALFSSKPSLTAGKKYYVSFFIKNFTAIRSSVNIWDIIPNTTHRFVISWTDGVPSTYFKSTAITEITYTKLVGTGEYLVSFAYTVPTGSSEHRFLLLPEVSTVSTNGIIVTGVQLATTLTSYIPTTSTPVTSAADVLHYAVGDVITQGQGSLYCEFWDCNINGSLRVVFLLSDGTASNKVWVLIDTLGKLTLNIKLAGTNVMYSATTSLSSTLNKVLISYQDNLSKVYVNGVLIETDDSCIIPLGLSTLHIGVSETATYVLNSEIGNVKYFKEVLTEAEAIKLTTI